MKRPIPIELSIPEPCIQDWNGMHANENGKFCEHCKKTVIDFSGMSDAAILAYVKRNGVGCGRLRKDQLDRMVMPMEVSKRKLWPQVVLSLGFFLGLQKVTHAQNNTTPATVISPTDKSDIPNKNESSKNGNVAGDVISIEGTLTDERGNPLVSGSIMVLDASGVAIGGAVTDFDGVFVVKPLDDRFMGQTIILKPSYQRNDTTIAVLIDKSVNVFNVKLNVVASFSGMCMVGGIRKVHYTPWQRAKRKVRQTFYRRTH